MTAQEYSVGEVAEFAHVSVRTLHHYDEVGLVRPSERTAAGHRRYSAADLHRLREVLFYRELDFGLNEIGSMLDDPVDGVDVRLRAQHRMLRERIGRQRDLLAALEKEMEARRMGISLTPEEQFEIFGSDKFTGEYAQEAEQRWGDTDAWKESARRTAAYTKQDWIEIKAEDEATTATFVELLHAGQPADGERAVAAAEAHRQHISQRFYECSHSFHRCLGQMYVADERFRTSYEEKAAGLAQYVHDAIQANADAHGA